MKYKLLTILLFALLTTFFLNNNKSNKKIVKDQKVQQFEEIYYEIKKCFLFKKYCLINYPKTYHSLTKVMTDWKLNQDCIFRKECSYTNLDLKGMSLIFHQSKRLKKYKSMFDVCEKSNEDWKYIEYLTLSSSLIDKEQKQDIFKNLDLKVKLEEIRKDLVRCQKE